ncbi:alpha/beta fold hydrolase [Geodermatophilus sp. SYSU D00814]
MSQLGPDHVGPRRRVTNELTVRGVSGGPRLLNSVRVEGSELDHRARTLLILIHGYQNSPARARKSWDEFVNRLMGSLWLRSINDLASAWGFQWPGDLPDKIQSILSYAARPGDAARSGQLLATHLASRTKQHQRVFIVGHSLGCRVALEALKFIRLEHQPYEGARIEGVFLLAPAVPLSFCQPNMDLGTPQNPPTEHVYYSPRDSALGWVFDRGQRLYGEPGNALGRSGLPPRMRWHRRVNTLLKHGQYWSSSTIAADIGLAMSWPGSWQVSPKEDTPDEVELAEYRPPEYDPYVNI